MISWGIVLMCNAAVKDKGGLFATRFLLGLVRFMPMVPLILKIKLYMSHKLS